MGNTVILGGARTPFGKLSGSLGSKSAVELGTIALNAAIDRSGVERRSIEHVTFGQVLQGGAGQNPARQVSFAAGLDRTVTSETINHVCGSGIRAVGLADNAIRVGDQKVIATGGMESMTNAPYILRGARGGYRMGDGKIEDMMVLDGLFCAIEHESMGAICGVVGDEHHITRQEQDVWALRSHLKAIDAIDSGWMARQIVPVEVAGRRETTIVDTDEAPRRDTSLEALARLKPAFAAAGTITAGNAPGVNDGATATIIADAEWASAEGLPVQAHILGHAQAAWDAPYLAYTPAMATELALKKAGLTVADVDLFEINEAFASVTIISTQRLGIDPEKVNIHGGAIALGHPLAASGGRLLLTLIESLKDIGGGIGVAAICTGGGQGDAIVIRVDG